VKSISDAFCTFQFHGIVIALPPGLTISTYVCIP